MKDNETYLISDELLEYQKNNPKLIINRDTPDYGPVLKIVGGLKYATNPDDILIALDDDEIYHEEMLEYNVKKINEHPDCVICHRGDVSLDKRDFIENGLRKYKYGSGHISFPANRDNYLLMPGHSHSVCYKRNFFKEDFNEELWSQADGDDPMIGYYARIHEVPILCVKWDKETDFRIVNVDKPRYASFPVIGELPYNMTDGGDLIRKKFEDANGYSEIHGRMSDEIKKILYESWNKIYIEKNQ
jgi:hypothetical protein